MTIKHVPGIDIQIHFIKYTSMACHHTIPFKYISKVILVDMMTNCEICLNMFALNMIPSTSFSPHTILIGVKFCYNKYCQINFSQYAKVYQ